MLIKITDPVTQTIFFSVIFLLLLAFSIRKIQNDTFFSKDVTEQLKGFAILAIVCSHIGYFLSTDTRFLFPLSVLAGVGVDLFLFLSGFGLTLSHLKNPLSVFSFYKRRLLKLFTPLWIIITIFFLLDLFILHKSYPVLEIIRSFFGFYPKADLFQNLNSPLWYFSIILFYYLIFPLAVIRKVPLFSPVLVIAISLLAFSLPLPVDPGVLGLYKLHFLAFPLGMMFGLIIPHLKFKPNLIIRFFILIIASFILFYTAIHSGVGADPKIEQGISLLTTFSAIVIFTLLPFRFKLFSIVGIYSYEIYLLHWPILSRYNLFSGLPPFLMVIFNLVLFIILAWTLQKAVKKIL